MCIRDRDEGIQLGERIAVIGRGRLVVNTARLLRRMGKIVTCAVVESDDEPEMSEGSFQSMVGEGIDLRTGAVAKQIISEGGQVKAVELVKAGYTMDSNGMTMTQQSMPTSVIGQLPLIQSVKL